MHRFDYAHTIARSNALILTALLSSSVSAEFYAPEVFIHAPLHTITTEPTPSSNLQNARLQAKKDNTELASSIERPNSLWISVPAKMPQLSQPPEPKLRF